MTQLRVRRKGTEKGLEYVADANPLPVAVTETPIGGSVEDLLAELLIEQKITNVHLSVVTGEVFNADDIPDEVV